MKQKPQLKLHKTSSLHIKPNHFFTKELITNRYLFALYFPLNYECMYNYVISLSRIPIRINKEIWPIVCEILVLLPLPSGCFPVFVSCNFLGGVGSQICKRIFLHTSLKLFTQQSTLSTWILHIGVKKKKKKKKLGGAFEHNFCPQGMGWKFLQTRLKCSKGCPGGDVKVSNWSTHTQLKTD